MARDTIAGQYTFWEARAIESGNRAHRAELQNPSDYTISGAVYFWNPPGALISTAPFSLAPRQLLVLATQLLAPGVSGSMTIAHDGSYGDLAGRAVSLEPSTGLGLEHPMVPRFR